MAETIKIVDLDIDEKELLQKLQKLTDEITDLKTETKKLETANKNLDAEGKKNTDQYKENSAQIERNKIQTKNLSTEYRSNQNVLVALNATETKQLGTLQQLELSNKKLRAESKTLDLTRKDGQKRLKEINTQLDQNNKMVLENADATKAQKMNIGNYGSALQGLPGPLGAAINGIRGMTRAAIAFIATPLGAILAAIAVVVKLISAAFKNSQPLLDKFQQAGAAIGAVWDVIIDRITVFVEKVVGALKNPKEAIKDFGKSIVDNILNRFKALPQIAIKVFEAVKNAMKGNFDEAKQSAKEAGEAIIQAVTGLTPERQKEIADGIRGVADEISNEARQARDLAAALQVLRDLEIADITRKAIMKRDIALLRLDSKASNITAQEKLELLQKAMKLEEELLSIEMAAAIERARISQEKTDMGKSDAEEMEANARLQAEVYNLEAVSAGRRRTLASELKTAEIAAAKETVEYREAEALAAAKAVDNEIKLETIKSLTINDIQDQDIEKLKERSEKIKAVHQDVADTKLTLAEIVNSGELALAKGLLANLTTIFGEESKVGKAAAVAHTTISALQGAQAAFTSLSGIPIVGVPLGIAAGAAALAAGYKNVQKILAVKTPGGGGGGGGSGMPSGGGMPSPTGMKLAAVMDGGLTTQGVTKSALALTEETMVKALNKASQKNVLIIEEATAKQKSQEGISQVTAV